MSPSELADLFQNNPTTPFRLTLASGDVVDVDNPSRTIFESLALFVGQADDPEARFAKRVKIVSIPNILLVERLDPRRFRGGRRRR